MTAPYVANRRTSWPQLLFGAMTKVLAVADADWVMRGLRAALSDPSFEIIEHEDPRTLLDAIVDSAPDVVVSDLQVGSMGGMAITRAVRQAAALEEIPATPVVLLLDRGADAFLARRAGAAGWVGKPINAFELRDVIAAARVEP